MLRHINPLFRYGMIAFGRSPDGQYVDCMYVMYKMDFKVNICGTSFFFQLVFYWHIPPCVFCTNWNNVATLLYFFNFAALLLRTIADLFADLNWPWILAEHMSILCHVCLIRIISKHYLDQCTPTFKNQFELCN